MPTAAPRPPPLIEHGDTDDAMAGEKAKRKLAGTGPAMPPGKKQKTHPQPKSKKKSNRLAGASSLRWTTSKIPDMTGDAEGFYGLEEVDDVEVIKNPDNTVQFVRAVCLAWPATPWFATGR